jgi:peptide/nickel transport system substrate-binding protein
MLAMKQVEGFIMDPTQGSDWRGNWWPQLERWVPTTENGHQVIYNTPQYITLQDGTKVPIYMRYDFGLRPGLKWSDGQPITADDYIFGTLIYLTNNMPVAGIDPYDSIARIEKLDNYTIRVYFTAIDKNNPYNVYAKYGLPLYPKHWFEKNVLKTTLTFPKTVDFVLKHNGATYLGDQSYTLPKNLKQVMDKNVETIANSSFNTSPVYAGPYKVANWVQKSYMELAPNSNYFLGPGLFDKVIVAFRSVESGLAELLRGQPDMALLGVINTQNSKTLAANSSFMKAYRLNNLQSVGWQHLTVNFDDPNNLPPDPKPGVAYTHPFLGDVKVRQALSYAINRQDISNRIYYGMRPVCYNFVLPGGSFDEASLKKVFVYDPSKANSLLQQAGFKKGSDGIYAKNGKKLSLTANMGNSTDPIRVVQLIQQQFKQVGINLSMQALDSAAFFNTVLPHRQYEIALFTWSQSSILEPGGNTLYQSNYVPSAANGYQGQNYSGFRNAQADALIAKWNSFNTSERAQAYKNFAKNYWSVYMPEIPLLWTDQHDAVKLNIEGYDVGLDVGPHTWNSAYWYRE